MTEYLSLQKLYYRDKTNERFANSQAEATKRLYEPSTFRTGIETENGELFLAMPRQLSTLSERLLRVERRVSRLWRNLPGIAQWAYLRGLIINEIVCNNDIEGVNSTRRQIEAALAATGSQLATAKTKRFREFARLYLQLTDNDHIYPQTPADIRGIYDAVVASELEKHLHPDGELFRKDAVVILSPAQKVIHQGVIPEAKIYRMLEQMIELVGSSDIPPTYAAIISHYLFEYIHPFYDGNGRLGRYLLSLYLSEPLSIATILSLSAIIADNKAKYYRAFSDAESQMNYGEMTFFVIQIMEFIRLAQDALIEDLEKKIVLLSLVEESLESLDNQPYALTAGEKDVIYIVAQYHLFNIFSEISLSDINENSKYATQAIRKRTISLEQKGLLRTISRKPLVFELTENALAVLQLL